MKVISVAKKSQAKDAINGATGRWMMEIGRTINSKGAR